MTIRRTSQLELRNREAVIQDLKRSIRARTVAAAGIALALAAACTFEPGYRDNPFQRSFAWFSYLNGDDIRKACGPGAPDRYRIVYNGVRTEQVRTYDIAAAPAASGAAAADLTMQVFQSQPPVNAIVLTGPLGPWRGRTERRTIMEKDFAAIRDALRASGFHTPPPRGTRVRSWSFFWLAAACEDGRFVYNAWPYDTPRFAQVVLREPLMAVDPTGVPFNPPREVELDRQKEEERDYYELVITPDGIAGQFTPF